jgi:hypothetical protein
LVFKLITTKKIIAMKKVILSLAVIALTGFYMQAQTTQLNAGQKDVPNPQQTKDAQRVQQNNATATPAVEDKNAADIVFESEVVDYGTIAHFADGEREFKFKNKGKSPLIITNCQGSCGCTVPTWPKEAIKPGESGTIKVKYATDRVGIIDKSVTVMSNAKTPSKVLKIKGNVLAEPATKPGEPTPTPAVAPTGAPAHDEHAGHKH